MWDRSEREGYSSQSGSQSGSFSAPVKAGDEIEVTIQAVGAKGDGIAKKDGFVIFVPNTQSGDRVRIRITKVLAKVGFAEVVGRGGDSSKSEAKETKGEKSAGGEDNESNMAPVKEEEFFEGHEDSEDFGEDLDED